MKIKSIQDPSTSEAFLMIANARKRMYTVGHSLSPDILFFICSTGRWADTAATVQPNR